MTSNDGCVKYFYLSFQVMLDYDFNDECVKHFFDFFCLNVK